MVSQLGLLVAAVFFNLFSRMMFSPLLPAMERDLGFSYARGGSFFFYMAAGYAGSMLLSGFFFSNRITHRRTIDVTLFTVSLGPVLVTIAPAVVYIPPGLLVIGIGAGVVPYLLGAIAERASFTAGSTLVRAAVGATPLGAPRVERAEGR